MCPVQMVDTLLPQHPQRTLPFHQGLNMMKPHEGADQTSQHKSQLPRELVTSTDRRLRGLNGGPNRLSVAKYAKLIASDYLGFQRQA